MSSNKTVRDATLFWTPPAARFLLAIGAWLGFLIWVRKFTLPDEGRYAGVAWDMLRSGSHAVPLLNGMPYFHKPPLYYWLTELSFSMFGVYEWSARLPSWLAAWAAAAALYLFVRRYRDAGSATLAVLVLATMPFFYGGAQFANLDMMVAGMITLCILAGADTVLRAERGQSYRWMSLATAVLAALAVLAKGLIGLVLPGATLFLWLLLARRWRGMAVLLWPPALLAFIVVVVPWFWLMQQRFEGFFDYFFVYQHFQRFAQSGFNNVQPFWFYLPVIAGLVLPWSLWGGGILRKVFWADSTSADLRRLAAVWLVVVVVFFSVPSSKLIGYVLPALPPLAFLLSEVMAGALRHDPQGMRRWVWVSLAAGAGICVVAVVAAAFHARVGIVPVARILQRTMQPGDTLISLRSYPFDLPLYARTEQPMWVVNDWDNPDVAIRDNWRKELFDAAKFNPQLGEQVLVTPAQFQARLCAAPDGRRFWVRGNNDDRARYAVLTGMKLVYTSSNHTLWRVDTDTEFRRRVCAGTPTDDSQ